MATAAFQEVIHSLVEFKSETSAALSALETKIDGINRRLDVSNGHLAQHDVAIQDLLVRESQTRTRLDQIEDERQGRLANERGLRMAMIERFLWLVGSLVLALTVHFLGL
jgi:hypothetical protein